MLYYILALLIVCALFGWIKRRHRGMGGFIYRPEPLSTPTPPVIAPRWTLALPATKKERTYTTVWQGTLGYDQIQAVAQRLAQSYGRPVALLSPSNILLNVIHPHKG